MPGIRVDRFLASTALVLVLSAGSGGAFADPTADQASKATTPGIGHRQYTNPGFGGSRSGGYRARPNTFGSHAAPDTRSGSSRRDTGDRHIGHHQYITPSFGD